jgi:hypothetical protein
MIVTQFAITRKKRVQKYKKNMKQEAIREVFLKKKLFFLHGRSFFTKFAPTKQRLDKKNNQS